MTLAYVCLALSIAVLSALGLDAARRLVKRAKRFAFRHVIICWNCKGWVLLTRQTYEEYGEPFTTYVSETTTEQKQFVHMYCNKCKERVHTRLELHTLPTRKHVS